MHGNIKLMVVKLVWMSTSYLVIFITVYQVYMVYKVYILHSNCNLMLSNFYFVICKCANSDYIIKYFKEQL